MSFIVTENCICCRYTTCVSVCPANCFHISGNFVVINPVTCIDCALCVPECPLNAIHNEYDLDYNNIKFIKINEHFSKKWPLVLKKKTTLPFAKEWEKISKKLHYLQTQEKNLLGAGSNRQPTG